MNNEDLYKEALKAINALFADRSVGVKKALSNLKSLQDEIEILVESLA